MHGGEREENLRVILLYFINLFYKAGKDNNSTFVNFNFLVKKILEKINPFLMGIKAPYYLFLIEVQLIYSVVLVVLGYTKVSQ